MPGNGTNEGSAPGDLLEIRILHLERHRPPGDLPRLAVAPDLRRQRGKLGLRGVELENVLREGVFRPNRLPLPVRLYRPLVDPTRNPIVPCSRFSEIRLQELERL